MYNGIGLTTPRGSGTNGYIQGNKFFVKAKTNRVSDATKPFEAGQGTAGLTTKKPNKDILEHDRKRQIELKIVILEDKLTEQGYTESEIAEKLVEARKALEAQQEKDEEEGEVIPTPIHQKKVSDTQTHQIAARKEKQMETFRAALGIGLSDSALPPLPNNRKNNDDNRREHTFLDRDPPVAAAMDVDDLKVKADKKKGEAVGDEIDESRLRKKKKEKKRSRRHDSDTDTDSSGEYLKKRTRKKKSRKGYSSESESDDFASGRKRRKSAKKHARRRSLDSDKSYSDSDTESDDAGKRDVHKIKSSRRRHNSSEDDSDTDGSREKKRGEVQKRKSELTDSQRRGRGSMSSESDSDADRGRDRKRGTVKKGSHRHDSSEDDSDTDSGRVKNRGEVQKQKIELKGNQKRGRGKVDSESDSDADRGRDRKRETVKKGRNGNDTEDDSDSNIVSDEKVEKSRARGRRHDSDDDEDSTPSHGRKSAAATATAPREKAARRRSVSLTDDSDTSSSDDDSDNSNLKYQIIDKKNVIDKDRVGHRGDDDTRGVRGIPRSSQEEKAFASAAAKKDNKRGRTLNEDDGLEKNREMKGKRKLDDEHHDEGPESKSRSRNLGRELEHQRDNPKDAKDAKFDSESNARAYREKDDRKRDDYSRWEKDDRKNDDYSRSVKTGGEFDGYNVRYDGRIQSKKSEPHRGSRRDDSDYEARRGGERHGRHEEEPRRREHRRDEMGHKYRSHGRDEEEHRIREHERDEMGHKYRSYERDDEPLHGSHRQRKGEEDNRGNKGHVRDRKLDRSEKMAYDDARSSERRSRRDERR